MHLVFFPVSKDSRPHFSGEKCALQVPFIVRNPLSFKNRVKIYVEFRVLDSFNTSLIVKKGY